MTETVSFRVYVDPDANPEVIGRRFEGDGVEFTGFANRKPCPVVTFEVAEPVESFCARLELDPDVVKYDQS